MNPSQGTQAIHTIENTPQCSQAIMPQVTVPLATVPQVTVPQTTVSRATVHRLNHHSICQSHLLLKGQSHHAQKYYIIM